MNSTGDRRPERERDPESLPDVLYVALHTSDGEVPAGTTNYERAAVPREEWDVDLSAGEIVNTGEIWFPPASERWGRLVRVSIEPTAGPDPDAESGASGIGPETIAAGRLYGTPAVGSDDNVRIRPGDLSLDLPAD